MTIPFHEAFSNLPEELQTHVLDSKDRACGDYILNHAHMLLVYTWLYHPRRHLVSTGHTLVMDRAKEDPGGMLHLAVKLNLPSTELRNLLRDLPHLSETLLYGTLSEAVRLGHVAQVQVFLEDFPLFVNDHLGYLVCRAFASKRLHTLRLLLIHGTAHAPDLVRGSVFELLRESVLKADHVSIEAIFRLTSAPITHMSTVPHWTDVFDGLVDMVDRVAPRIVSDLAKKQDIVDAEKRVRVLILLLSRLDHARAQLYYQRVLLWTILSDTSDASSNKNIVSLLICSYGQDFLHIGLNPNTAFTQDVSPLSYCAASGNTPLNTAIMQKSEDHILDVFLGCRLVNVTSEAMVLAVIMERPDLLLRMLSRMKLEDVVLRRVYAEPALFTALHMCNYEISILILESTVHLDLKPPLRREMFSFLEPKLVMGMGDLTSGRREGCTALQMALSRGMYSLAHTIQDLMDLRANELVQNKTVLQLVMYSVSSSLDMYEPPGNLMILVELLVKEHVVTLNHQDEDGRTALHMVCESVLCANEGILGKIVRSMLDVPCLELNHVDRFGRTPLACLVQSGRDASVVRDLLDDPRTDPCVIHADGQTDLHLACRDRTSSMRESQKILAELLNHPRTQANINRRDDMGKTAFHLACQDGWQEGVILMVEDERVDVGVTDLAGVTPLHTCVRKPSLKYQVISRYILLRCSTQRLEPRHRNSALRMLCGGSLAGHGVRGFRGGTSPSNTSTPIYMPAIPLFNPHLGVYTTPTSTPTRVKLTSPKSRTARYPEGDDLLIDAFLEDDATDFNAADEETGETPLSLLSLAGCNKRNCDVALSTLSRIQRDVDLSPSLSVGPVNPVVAVAKRLLSLPHRSKHMLSTRRVLDHLMRLAGDDQEKDGKMCCDSFRYYLTRRQFDIVFERLYV